ncbi:MAG: 5-formyltetrahydrofolate cyclo-ligase [Elainellaceae cyanobacterium]
MDEALTNPIKPQKTLLRRSLLSQRQSLSTEAWRYRSDRLCEHLQNSTLFAQSQTILAYFSIRQEVDLSPLFTYPKRWGFPRCVEKTLFWHLWSPTDALPLQAGKYGILEPDSAAVSIAPDEVDLVLVPAIACDMRGYRLGYGGGFYDRLLSSPPWVAKPTIGIVFEFARLPELPIDDWDCPLQAVCTEAGLFPVPQ